MWKVTRVPLGTAIELISKDPDGADGPGSGRSVERLGLLRVVPECLPGELRRLSRRPPIPPEIGAQDPENDETVVRWRYP
jgi:hypothetical protein